ncbi:heat-shock protein Hsp20 [Natrinema saccharevitans]|uniref:Heat-shock protein Hsp20 n=1 Tax=Natrinema saccharevitans TaxID=301967 RepID=A0A1S8AYM8_9EURY|nr:Hsp20/alpha crystallin family protein [Natrinema saccharevitans]OLZ41978.1 heat-shock protein Hsp20 [Natrinema saccharevitans]
MSLKDLGSSVGRTLYRQIGRANGRVQNHRSLAVDILETDDAYRVVFDAPGAEPDDVQVRYLDGTVKLRIDRFRGFHEGYEMRFPGRGMSLSGVAELPADAVVDPDAGTARLTETGTLSVEIPKGSSLEESDRSASAETDTEPVTVDD